LILKTTAVIFAAMDGLDNMSVTATHEPGRPQCGTEAGVSASTMVERLNNQGDLMVRAAAPAIGDARRGNEDP
jgi:hypothetical protein